MALTNRVLACGAALLLVVTGTAQAAADHQWPASHPHWFAPSGKKDCDSDSDCAGTLVCGVGEHWYSDDPCIAPPESNDAAADAYRVEGAKKYGGGFNGVYAKTGHACNGKPVYQKGDGPVLFRVYYFYELPLSVSYQTWEDAGFQGSWEREGSVPYWMVATTLDFDDGGPCEGHNAKNVFLTTMTRQGAGRAGFSSHPDGANGLWEEFTPSNPGSEQGQWQDNNELSITGITPTAACSGSVCQEPRFTSTADTASGGYCCESGGTNMVYTGAGISVKCMVPQDCTPTPPPPPPPPPPPVNCDGGYGSWGSCSATCGGGTQSRTFTVTRTAAHGGNSCAHSNGHVESRVCNSQRCHTPPMGDVETSSGAAQQELAERRAGEGSAVPVVLLVLVHVAVVAAVALHVWRRHSNRELQVKLVAAGGDVEAGIAATPSLPVEAVYTVHTQPSAV